MLQIEAGADSVTRTQPSLTSHPASHIVASESEHYVTPCPDGPVPGNGCYNFNIPAQ